MIGQAPDFAWRATHCPPSAARQGKGKKKNRNRQKKTDNFAVKGCIFFALSCYLISFNLNELSTTLTLEQAIRALAHIGVIWKSMPKRCKAPAANGMQTML